MMRYLSPKGTDWIQPIRRGYKVQFQCARDERATAAARRKFESIKVIKRKKQP